MIDINGWMHVFLQKLNEVFGSRVWFVGLQGSYVVARPLKPVI